MTGAELAALWAGVATTVAAQAHMPPPKLPDAWDQVAAGKVVRSESGDSPRRVVAVGLLNVSREEAWLSLTDDHLADNISGLTELVLDGGWAHAKTLYQRLDLPWPVADRHWVIRLGNNAGLAAAGVWERYWSVDEAALAGARARTDTDAFDAAVAVTVNLGDWLLVRAGSQTLAIYQAKVSLGGLVPDDAVDAYTRSQTEGMYAGVVRNAAKVRARYGPGCTPQPAPDGSPIPCFP